MSRPKKCGALARSFIGSLAIFVVGCGQVGSRSVSPGPPIVRPVCLTTRCAQIFSGIGVPDVKFFPYYGSIYGDPDPLTELRTYSSIRKPGLIVDSSPGSQKLPDDIPVLRLSGQGLSELYRDIRRVGEAVDRKSEAARLVVDLKKAEQNSVSPQGLTMTAVWLSGSSDNVPYFNNDAIAPSDEDSLLAKYFVRVLDGTTKNYRLDVSLDELVDIDPDVIFFSNVLNEGKVPNEIAEDARWKNLKAVKSDQMFFVQSTDLEGFGPRDYFDFYEALEELPR